MHDLDRTMFEAADSGEFEQDESNEFLELLGAEIGGELGGETAGPHAIGETSLGEAQQLHELHEVLGEQSSEAHETAQALETYETELALELLEVSDEAELDRFIGKLVSRAAGAARTFARSSTGRQLGGILKQAAKQALPVLGQGLGGLVSPGGATVGRKLGKAASDVFGLELEGLSAEDRELEVARAFVRFGSQAVRNAVLAPPSAPSVAVARAAVTTAAKSHAPGLIRPNQAELRGLPRRGRWVRRGNTIVLFGV